MIEQVHRFKIPDQIYDDLLKCLENKGDKWNKELAGNIKEEYSLKHHAKKFEHFLLSQIPNSKYLTEYFDEIAILDPNPLPLTLQNFWVNFQKKHEFNPLHKHQGLFSFVLFMKIPFLIEQEKLLCPGVESNNNKPGGLGFVFPSNKVMGGIQAFTLEVDQRWERTGVIFRADLSHFVNPFFSDGTRITISGNIMLDTSGVVEYGV
tara:strand:- start:852 stop:1469 length:618 start_codon:yes stop_codon:yes gene_type:complete